MKKIILLTASLSFVLLMFGQNAKYVSAMEKNIATLDTTHSIASFQVLANSFERISNAEKAEWLPEYYIAYSYLMMANVEKDNDKVDGYCDKAEEYLDKADLKSANNSEIYVLKGWAASSRIKVNPMIRGQKYGTISATNQEKAKSMNPNNPRPYLMLGMGKYFTPAMFGGGKDKAKPLLEESVNKFKTFKLGSSIMPHWGEKMANDMYAECKKD
ncbi:MAG: hypothetical protein WCL14_09945 [Bacteroidota bacterium]